MDYLIFHRKENFEWATRDFKMATFNGDGELNWIKTKKKKKEGESNWIASWESIGTERIPLPIWVLLTQCSNIAKTFICHATDQFSWNDQIQPANKEEANPPPPLPSFPSSPHHHQRKEACKRVSQLASTLITPFLIRNRGNWLNLTRSHPQKCNSLAAEFHTTVLNVSKRFITATMCSASSNNTIRLFHERHDTQAAAAAAGEDVSSQSYLENCQDWFNPCRSIYKNPHFILDGLKSSAAQSSRTVATAQLGSGQVKSSQ